MNKHKIKQIFRKINGIARGNDTVDVAHACIDIALHCVTAFITDDELERFKKEGKEFGDKIVMSAMKDGSEINGETHITFGYSAMSMLMTLLSMSIKVLTDMAESNNYRPADTEEEAAEQMPHPIKTTVVTQDEVDRLGCSEYRVTTIVPLVENPTKKVYIVDQEALEALLVGYEEYAEFIVSVERLV